MLGINTELSPEFTDTNGNSYQGIDGFEFDFESLSTRKKGYIETINNPEVNKVLDETRVAKESILDY